MALDIYVGSLTRYYSEQWENVAQAWARKTGIDYKIVHPDGNTSPGASENPVQPGLSQREKESVQTNNVHTAIVEWQKRLEAALPFKLIAWQETLDAPYFTDRPSSNEYGGLMLWAAYEEHQDMKRPVSIPAQWDNDRAVKASVDESFSSHYAHLLQAEIWLPGEFEFLFKGATPNGARLTFGSSSILLRELEELNRRTWQAAPENFEVLRQREGEDSNQLEISAQLGFDIFYRLAKLSVEHSLPMLLDY